MSRVSIFSCKHEVYQLLEKPGFAIYALKNFIAFIGENVRAELGTVKSVQLNRRTLIFIAVLADSLSQIDKIALNVQNIIGELKKTTQIFTE